MQERKEEKEKKEESIKIRVTKKQKDKLISLSKLRKESLSSYILNECLKEEDDLFAPLPQYIDMLNSLNEIYHIVQKQGDSQLKERVRTVYQKYTDKSKKGDF